VTERLNRFVDRKAGSIGRNLEQDAARLVEIDLPSSVAAVLVYVPHGRWTQNQPLQADCYVVAIAQAVN